jgi:hypothetical protein
MPVEDAAHSAGPALIVFRGEVEKIAAQIVLLLSSLAAAIDTRG